jgi:hypothetical protein
MSVIPFDRDQRPIIKLEYVSQIAFETLKVLYDRSVIFRDNTNLFELRIVPPRDKFERFDFRLCKINSLRLQMLMQRAAIFMKLDDRSDEWKRCDAPIWVARWVLKDQKSWPFKRLQTPDPINHFGELS